MLLNHGVLAQADAQAIPLPSNYFHSVITSPPYYGLRVYSGGDIQKRVWGGSSDCIHVWIEAEAKMQTGGISAKQISNRGVTGMGWISTHAACENCDAWYGSLGLEPTPEQHVQNMVLVAREVWRVLRDDGVFWLNYGDTYAGSGQGGQSASVRTNKWARYPSRPYKGLSGGNLILMPHQVAIALQRDGWTVRNDLVWHKPNPMPEPAAGWRWERHRLKIQSAEIDWKEEARRTDRPLDGPAHVGGGNTGFSGHFAKWEPCEGCEKCDPNEGYILRKGSWRHTRAHEYFFQFTKGMNYYCDQEVIRQAYDLPLDRWGGELQLVAEDMDGSERPTRPDQGGKNPRSVLKIPTSSYKGAHYATFAPDLISPLIQASVPTRACPECGQGWAPVVDKGEPTFGATSWGLEGRRHFKVEKEGMVETSLEEGSTLKHDVPRTVRGYLPTCDCGREDHIPGIVLDIFGGSGTTGMVAKSLLRRWALIDIGRGYIDEQMKIRTGQGTPSKALDDLPLFSGGRDGEEKKE